MNREFGAAKQVMDFQKAAIGGMFLSTKMIWNQTETIFNMVFTLNPWIPEEGKKMVRQWVDFNKKNCDYLKDLFETGFSSLEAGFNGMNKMSRSAEAARSFFYPFKQNTSNDEKVVETPPLKPVVNMTSGSQEQQGNGDLHQDEQMEERQEEQQE